MDARKRAKLMELNAEPPPQVDGEAQALEMLKLIVQACERGEFVIKRFNMQTYRDFDTVRTYNDPYVRQLLRGDQLMTGEFLIAPTGVSYSGEPSDEKPARPTRNKEQPTRKNGERDLIFED